MKKFLNIIPPRIKKFCKLLQSYTHIPTGRQSGCLHICRRKAHFYANTIQDKRKKKRSPILRNARWTSLRHLSDVRVVWIKGAKSTRKRRANVAAYFHGWSRPADSLPRDIFIGPERGIFGRVTMLAMVKSTNEQRVTRTFENREGAFEEDERRRRRRRLSLSALSSIM